MRKVLILLVTLATLATLLFVIGFHNARADPVVRRATIALPGWPAGAGPVRAVLISDVHVGNATMDVARLTRIVAQVNALAPDLVLIAGDFGAGHDPAAAPAITAALAPLADLRARLGVVATLGNHDHWINLRLIHAALAKAGVTVLDNAATVRGPLAIGGVGDAFTHHQDIGKTIAALRALPGARLVVTHSPDIAPSLPPDVRLLLAGHTHCGQIVLPLYGPIVSVAAPRYRCGVIRENGRAIVVTGGLGTSSVPLRFGAPPDLWVLTLGPARPF